MVEGEQHRARTYFGDARAEMNRGSANAIGESMAGGRHIPKLKLGHLYLNELSQILVQKEGQSPCSKSIVLINMNGFQQILCLNP